MDELKKKYGIVVLLDALGAKDYSEKKIKEFLNTRNRITNALATRAPMIKGTLGEEFTVAPVSYTFGDTVVIVSELDNVDDKKRLKQIIAMTILVQSLLLGAMEGELLMRGAFAIGEYFDDEDSNTVIGQAVSDAASWYEKSEWFGVAGTPSAYFHIENLVRKFKTEYTARLLIPYDVPLKDGKSQMLLCVSWPGFLVSWKGEDANQRYFEMISKMSIPIGTEHKYFNSNKFFLDVMALCKVEESSEVNRMINFKNES